MIESNSLGTFSGDHDVRALYQGLAQARQHLFKVPSLSNALAEGGIVGFGGSPALDEGERQLVILVSVKIEGFTAVGRSHAVPAFDQKWFECALLALSGVKLGDERDTH
jgi:hypothetical protein